MSIKNTLIKVLGGYTFEELHEKLKKCNTSYKNGECYAISRLRSQVVELPFGLSAQEWNDEVWSLINREYNRLKKYNDGTED